MFAVIRRLYGHFSVSARNEAPVSWTSLGICILAGLLLFYSWLLVPPVRSVWDGVDQAAFFTLNGSLALNKAWLYFWVLASSRWFDAIPAIALLSVYAILLKGRPREYWVFCGVQLACVLAFMGAWQFYAVDQLMEGRDSPGHVLQPFIRIKNVLEWVPDVKSGSHDSFPGDHASVLAFFCVLFVFLLKRKTSLVFLLFAPLFTLPRLMSGAHWLTDVLVGGVSCGLVGAALFLGIRNLVLRLYANRR